MTFMLKVVSQSDYFVSATYGDTECDIRPGDSVEIIAGDDATVTLVRREPPVAVAPLPPEGGPSYELTAAVVPDMGEAPLTVTLTLTETANHPADSFTINWGDASVEETTSERTLTHDYTVVGSYAGTIIATHGALTKKIDMPPVNVTEPPSRTTRRK